MAKVTLIVIALALVVVLGFFLMSNLGENDNKVTGNTIAGDLDNSGVPEVKTFVLTGDNFRFYMNGIESPELRVKLGDTVRIVFNNEEGFHDWKIDEFNAATKQIKAGESETIELVADRKGTFEYYCSVGQHRANGMKGNLIVS
ncbi:MAG: cupredoxin domain-containing protein [Nanoarchaeota archaeon]